MMDTVAFRILTESKLAGCQNPQYQQALHQAATTHIFEWKQEYFQTIYEENALEAWEVYENNPKDFFIPLETYISEALQLTSINDTPTIQITFCEPDNAPTTKIKNIRKQHVNTKINIQGTITSKTPITPMITGTLYQCGFCQTAKQITKKPDRDLPRNIPCNNCQKNHNQDHIMLPQKQTITDVIILHVDETYEDAKPEDIKKIYIKLKDHLATPDLDDKIQRGTRIRATGILQIEETKKTSYYYLDCYGIKPLGGEYDEITLTPHDIKKIQALPTQYTDIVRDYWAKQLYTPIDGFQNVKETLIVQQVNIKPIINGDKTTRGATHIALIGDGGTGKSTFGKLTKKYAIKAIKVAGGSSTGVGLTAAVIQDPITQQNMVAPGALPLAHGGTCIIDEADKAKDDDIKVLHEGLEDLEITKNAGNIHATFPCIIAALIIANPETGRFSEHKELYDQIPFQDTFISRMDIIWLFLRSENRKNLQTLGQKVLENMETAKENPETISFFKKYLKYCRNIQAQIPPNIQNTMVNWFVSTDNQIAIQGSKIVFTPRSLESLSRLSKNHAIANLRTTVNEQDTQWAIQIMQESMRHIAFDVTTLNIDTDKKETGYTQHTRTLRTDILNILAKQEKEILIDELKKILLQNPAYKELPYTEFETAIEKLKYQGQCTNPTPPYIRII